MSGDGGGVGVDGAGAVVVVEAGKDGLPAFPAFVIFRGPAGGVFFVGLELVDHPGGEVAGPGGVVWWPGGVVKEGWLVHGCRGSFWGAADTSDTRFPIITVSTHISDLLHIFCVVF